MKNSGFYTVGVEDMEVVLTHEALAPTFYAKYLGIPLSLLQTAVVAASL